MGNQHLIASGYLQSQVICSAQEAVLELEMRFIHITEIY